MAGVKFASLAISGSSRKWDNGIRLVEAIVSAMHQGISITIKETKRRGRMRDHQSYSKHVILIPVSASAYVTSLISNTISDIREPMCGRHYSRLGYFHS